MATLLRVTGPRPRVAVAFSGGLDSTVLVHALAGQRRKLSGLRLLHVDHALQPPSAAWAKSCAAFARSLSLPIEILQADIRRQRGESPEAAARDARYTLLAAAMESGEVLVTAQHRDDQVETLLLQLMRGAGVAGLAAMPECAVFGPGRIVRPLLAIRRADIEQAARAAELRWIEDPSNADTRYSRNFTRHRLLPLIREHWPGVDRALARTARHMADAQALLDERALADLAAAADGSALSVVALRALPEARRRNALRAFIARAGGEMPENSRLREICGPLLAARADSQPEVRWSNAAMRRRAGRVEIEIAANLPLESVAESWRWQQDRECILNGKGVLVLVNDRAGSIDLDKLPAELLLRGRRGGESLRPGPRARTRTLKKLMQDARLSVEERARLPLLFSGEGPKGRLIAAGDRWLDASVQANVKSRRRARLVWKRNGVTPHLRSR
jgi:tRNA(Ile)-lysidine synthase